jgi:branched-chain amino acid transport system permease protein
MDPAILTSVFLIGLATAMLLFLISSGLTLVFGVLGVINFAHGSLYMLGAYMAYSSFSLLQPLWGSFWLAAVISSIAVAVMGLAIESFILKRIYRAEEIYQILLTFSLVMIIDGLVKMIWGLDPKSITEPAVLSGSWKILGSSFPVYALFIILAGFGLSLLLWFFVNKTKYGKFIRAASSDRDMINALGVNVPFIFTGVFTLGSWLAAMGGVLAGPLRVINPEMGVSIIIESFAVIVIGGFGSLQGAFLGSLLIGLVDSFGIYFLPRFSMAFIYMLMTVVLLLKPTGLLGAEES